MVAPIGSDNVDGRAHSLRESQGVSMKVELRCPSTMHGKLQDDFIEVKCRRRSCGFKAGTVVLHRFDIHTGALVDTKRFADPRKAG